MLTFRPFLLALLLSLLAAPAALGATDKGAVIGNGTIQLGVNATGELNYDCAAAEDTGCPPDSLDGEPQVGIRYVPLNADGTGPDCDCEGWGFADAVSKLTGYANVSAGSANLKVDSFSAAPDGRSAISTVTIEEPDDPEEPEDDPKTDGYKMQVTHDYRPSPRSPNVYEGLVTVTNTGTKPIEDLRYRRVMDWDIEPTAFNEWVTVKGRSPQLLFNSDDGFAESDPLADRTSINSGPICAQTPEEAETGSYDHPCEYTDLGACPDVDAENPNTSPTRCSYPEATQADDHGALFDFGFGALAVGETKRFKVLYGAAPDEAAATRAMQNEGAEVYSLGQTSCPTDTPDGDDPDDDQPDQTGCADAPPNSGVERGAPVTFMFGFVTTRADVALTKVDAKDPVTVGENITYTLTATNNGPDATSSAEITDTLPDGLELVSATASQGSCSGTKTVVCGLGALGVGASATVTVVARTLAPGDVVNAATVTAVSEDPRPENNTATATTRVNPVTQVITPPVPEPPVSPILACTKKKLVLVDVYQASGRVQLLGAADASLVGKRVDLMFTGTGKRVARATVKSDGTFQTTAKLPPRRIRTTNRARYQAVVGKEKSDRLKLVRRVAVTSLSSAGRKITIRGKLSRPLAKPIRPIQVYQRVSCTKTKVVKTFKPAKSGAFKVTFDAPAGQDAAVYILRTFVRKTPRSKRPFLTKSLPRPVFIK